ncbi:hypothetical protein [Chitinophaga nivalis]|uniref:Uncharacterized protein n=1 Tax=Chitinophaga nivalis TaxID=2991709 RepID=A0ABT3IGJ0_9BACT|nr:hypothetical protein [Chitinophaga nivalis]MCW3467252.1 hypothetical protein [Chitinophaga nivalis]MCW3483056.1 hypothetical protein [Chitinophaga nivalis]
MKSTKIVLTALAVVAVIGGAFAFKSVGSNPPEQIFYKKRGQEKLVLLPNATSKVTPTLVSTPLDLEKGFYTTTVISSTTPTIAAYVANAQ